MPITNTDIIAGAVQSDGRRRHRYRYHFSEGKQREFDRNMTPAGFNAVADAAALVPEMEAAEKDEELRRVYDDVVSGADYVTERDAMLFNTENDLLEFIYKRTANRMRTPFDNQEIKDHAHEVIAFQIAWNESGNTIGGFLGVSTQLGNSFKSDVQNLMQAFTNYDVDATIPTFPEVE